MKGLTASALVRKAPKLASSRWKPSGCSRGTETGYVPGSPDSSCATVREKGKCKGGDSYESIVRLLWRSVRSKDRGERKLHTHYDGRCSYPCIRSPLEDNCCRDGS